MLPAVPKTIGRLSDVFASCLGAITGQDNRLTLPAAERVVAILVDGLGSFNIKAGAGHAPNLNRYLAQSKPIHAGFPSTTASSITSFGTGLQVGEHGIVGYKVLDPNTNEPVNQLTGWSKTIDPLKWQPQQTIAERAIASGVSAYVVGPSEYANSGFTALTMRGAQYVAANSLEQRFSTALQLMATSQTTLIYLYVPELDQKAHAFGVDSPQWLIALEELESSVAKLASSLDDKRFASAGALLTADHGVIDVPHSNQIFLDEFELPQLKLVAGDPRANYLYLADSLDDDAITETADALQAQLDATKRGSAVRVLTKNQLIQARWFGAEVSTEANKRMPELFAIAIGRTALYHRDFVPAKSLNMIGQHGSISAEELSIPLLRFGALAR
jgi:predicted AlkP superfamily pyrophosphatase or phosphodiesterase